MMWLLRTINRESSEEYFAPVVYGRCPGEGLAQNKAMRIGCDESRVSVLCKLDSSSEKSRFPMAWLAARGNPEQVAMTWLAARGSSKQLSVTRSALVGKASCSSSSRWFGFPRRGNACVRARSVQRSAPVCLARCLCAMDDLLAPSRQRL